MTERTPGLLLQSIPYLGQKKIFKVFTPNHGLLSFFVTKTNLSPFCLAEWVYRRTEKEIYPLLDATLLDPLLSLRQSYATLTAAGQIARDLLTSQLPYKPAPALYALAHLYLAKLPQSPDLLAASFSLKLLLHEGLLSSEREESFTLTEWEQVGRLAFLRQLSDLALVQEAPLQKIRQFFAERLHHP